MKGGIMYFLAHMYSILKVLPIGLSRDEIIKPMIIGSWCPDAGYFPLFSPKLKVFNHQEKPPIRLYKKNSQEGRAFELGWKLHILCDNIIHEKPFFADNNPLCPEIINNQGVKKYFKSARKHLGREVGLDLFIYERLLKKTSNIELLWVKDFYKKPVVSYTGFAKLQSYVYLYVNKFLPLVNRPSQLSRMAKKTIDYDFYLNEEIEEKIILFLENVQKECKKLIEKELIL